jgi:hypothetical protein
MKGVYWFRFVLKSWQILCASSHTVWKLDLSVRVGPYFMIAWKKQKKKKKSRRDFCSDALPIISNEADAIAHSIRIKEELDSYLSNSPVILMECAITHRNCVDLKAFNDAIKIDKYSTYIIVTSFSH